MVYIIISTKLGSITPYHSYPKQGNGVCFYFSWLRWLAKLSLSRDDKPQRLEIIPPSSHNHESGRWVPPKFRFAHLDSFRVIFHWTMIMGERKKWPLQIPPGTMETMGCLWCSSQAEAWYLSTNWPGDLSSMARLWMHGAPCQRKIHTEFLNQFKFKGHIHSLQLT